MSSMGWTGWRDCQIHDLGEKYEQDSYQICYRFVSYFLPWYNQKGGGDPV